MTTQTIVWCMEKNTIPGMMKDPENFDTSLVPSKGPDSPKYDGGWCIYLS